MSNEQKYRFADFTLQNYRRLIQIAKSQKFDFISFKDIPHIKSKNILWRHDVEFSPEIALKMAEIESGEQVQATYFFQLHSEFYNVLERHNTEILYRIKSLGHEIGLHFDTHFYNIEAEDDLEKYLKIDKAYFESVYGFKLNVFSFHNTNAFILNCKKKKYAGLLNVYSDFVMKRYSYCSDSTGIWRFEVLEDVLNDSRIRNLQVLTHDAMWQEDLLPPRQRVFRSIDARAEYLKSFYDERLAIFGVKNIDWD